MWINSQETVHTLKELIFLLCAVPKLAHENEWEDAKIYLHRKTKN